MITAIIIDDEPFSCESLAILLERHCPEVKILEICHSAANGLLAITNQKPQLLFLDIEMPHINGFEMLSKLATIDFQVIFTTSYDQYAIKAIRYSALDYLLKPIDKADLKSAVQKAIENHQKVSQNQIALLFERLAQPKSILNKIAIPTLEGLQLVNLESIIFCSADRNYTVFNMKNNLKITASRTLKDIEEMLAEHHFLRVHHSYLINLNEIEKYIKGEGGYLLMSNGTTVDVSRSRKEILIKRLQPNKT